MELYTDIMLYAVLCILCVLVQRVCMDRGDEDIEWEMGWGESETQGQVFRVVNGQPANLGDVPYQISLRLPLRSFPGKYKSFCGGALISKERLLSAAHCFHSLMSTDTSMASKNVSLAYAVAGSIRNINTMPPEDSTYGGQWRRLQSVQRPRGYSFPDHDIALVVTESKFVLNDFVMPIPIASQFQEYNGECLVAGYGRTSANSLTQSDVLLIAYLEPLSVSECSRLYRRNMSRFVCTSTRIADVAKGDSGGPLVCRNTGDDNESSLGVLAGIISASATVRLYGNREQVVRSAFFTRVSDYAGHLAHNAPLYVNDASRSCGVRQRGSVRQCAMCVVFMLIYVALFSS